MKQLFLIAVAIFVSVSLMAQAPVNLKLNLEKNKTYRLKSTAQQNITVTYGGTTQQVETNTTVNFSLKPLSMEGDFILADIKFDTTNLKVSMPAMVITSTKPGSLTSGNPNDAMNCILNRYSKAVFNVKLSQTGKVIEISNIKEISAELNKSLDSLQGQLATVKGQLSQMVSESAIKGTIETITGFLPGKPVNVGEKWDSNIKMAGSGMAMSINSSYKLKKVTGNMAEIAGDVTIEPVSQESSQNAQMSYDVRGLGKTTLTVDIKTGLISKTTSKYHLQGNMTVKAQGNEMQMPIEVDSETVVTALP